jgi:hypothetical protein
VGIQREQASFSEEVWMNKQQTWESETTIEVVGEVGNLGVVEV